MCEHFAAAQSFDEASGRYEGLHAGGGPLSPVALTMLVKPEAARRQLGADGATSTPTGPTEGTAAASNGVAPAVPPPLAKRRFFGSVEVSGDRLLKRLGQINEEVLRHLATAPGGSVRITLEIEARSPSGFGDDVQRIVIENGSTLRFAQTAFEAD